MSVPARTGGLRTGVAIVCAYVAVVALTIVAGHRARPLFDGYIPPAPYRWVNPPPDFAAGNVKPKAADYTVQLNDGVTPNGGVATDDGQLIINFPAGAAVPRHGNDNAIKVRVTPLDPARLTPVPARSAADGNAYRIALSYQPSGAAIDRLTAAGNIILRMPVRATSFLYSSDGRSWKPIVDVRIVDPTTLGASFTQGGYYLGATTPAHLASAGSKGSSTGRTVLIVVLVVALALALGFTPRLLRRRRSGRRPTRSQARSQARRRRRR